MARECKQIVEFEALVGLGSTKACLLIGVAYPTYAAYRNCSRVIKPYHRNHIEDISLIAKLSRRALKKLIDERVNGKTD